MKKKLYTIQKRILARSASEAIRLERSRVVDEVFINNEWEKANLPELESAIGFAAPLPAEEEEY